MMRSRQTAFTLIEVLTVIGIIALLAAILFPVFASIRENGLRSNCASNMKQLGLGLLQYSQDYDEAYPGYSNGGMPNWAYAIYPYVKSTSLFSCPDDPHSGDISYEYNWNIPQGLNGKNQGTGISSFVAPSNTVLLVEFDPDGLYPVAAIPDNSLSGASANDGWQIGTGCVAPFQVGHSWHVQPSGEGSPINTVNYAAADGHVKFLNVSAVSFHFGGVAPNDQKPDALNKGVALTVDMTDTGV